LLAGITIPVGSLFTHSVFFDAAVAAVLEVSAKEEAPVV
jgi:hypothetical protein